MSHTYTLGQQVIIVVQRNQGVDIYDAEILKVGRKWLTVKRQIYANHTVENQFDMDGRAVNFAGHAPQLWPDRATYEAHVERRRRWNEFHSLVRQQNYPPDHLTSDQIVGLIKMVTS